MLTLKGFPDKWNDWIMETMKGGCMGIKFNDSVGPFFPTFKSSRHGVSLSPLLFDLVAHALAIVMDNARKQGFVKGLLEETKEGVINMLQYANDTIFLPPMMIFLVLKI